MARSEVVIGVGLAVLGIGGAFGLIAAIAREAPTPPDPGQAPVPRRRPSPLHYAPMTQAPTVAAVPVAVQQIVQQIEPTAEPGAPALVQTQQDDVTSPAADEDEAESPADLPPVPDLPGPPGPPPGPPSLDPQEVEALGRMLASEDSRPAVEVVIGWYAIQHAARRHITLFRMLTGSSGAYGPQKLNGEVRYASTARPATEATRKLAMALLLGQVQPSAQIRAHGVSAWVELGVGGYTAQRILARQTYQADGPHHKQGAKDFGGIWGRLLGTRWYLYSQAAPVLQGGPTEEDAAAVLAQVPEIPATDQGPAVA